MLLEVIDVAVNYGSVEALHGISMSVDEREVVTVIGANGAGKTTMVKLLMRFYDVNSGTILVRSQRLRATLAEQRAN